MNSLVSILIPVYNRESLIEETLNSATQQTYDNIEIIVCDNCSTDNTWKVLETIAATDHRIKLYKNATNLGPVGNWKKCVTMASGVYSKILFSDDLISTNYIEETLKLMNDRTAFVLSDVKLFDKSGIVSNGYSYARKAKVSVNDYLKSILLDNTPSYPISPGAALFRTSDLIKNISISIENHLDLDFSKYGAGNDLLIYLDTARSYNFIAISGGSTSLFRIHDGSFTISNDLQIYYDFIKMAFIKKYKPSLLCKFYTFLKYSCWFNKINSVLIPYLGDCKIQNLYIVEIIYNKCIRKINQKGS